jgi:hypothetical protein
MTPKEKADKLCMRFLIQTTTDIPYGINKAIAKECALIAVDEIINIACDVSDYDKSVTKSYWIEVKQEIEAL